MKTDISVPEVFGVASRGGSILYNFIGFGFDIDLPALKVISGVRYAFSKS